MDAVNYYEHVEKVMGGREKAQSFSRLFMVPGMAHCRGGPGPNIFGNVIAPLQITIDTEHDVISALVQWVEKGLAPNYIIATHLTSGTIDRTRPLCPFPKIARWNGSGSSDDAKNFTCVETRTATPTRQVKK
jgi:feruloyl esterase